MPGDIDDVVYAAQNPEITIGGLHRAVTSEVWPVMPVFALRILVVFLVVLAHKALAVAPDRLENSRPRIADADIPCFARAGFHFLRVLVEDDGIDSRYRRTGAAWLHGIERWLGAAQEAAIFGLPPGVHDHGFAFAYNLVIPFPDRWLDWLADRGHVLEVVIVFLRLVRPGLAQHADGSGRGMEDVHIKPLRHAPRTSGIGIIRHTFIE